MESVGELVLKVSGLTTYFYVPGGVVKAADGVDLEIRKGETVTLVGESGCGKSVTALSIIRLISEPGKILSGEVLLDGKNILKLTKHEMQAVRGGHIAMVFQNPYTSLHPLFKIGAQMEETITFRRNLSRKEALPVAVDILRKVGVENTKHVLRSYPFEVSAGICQRVMLALALVCEPELLIADEPTTNLDSLAQIQVLELIKGMKEQLGMSVLLITHDFGVVSMMADRVVVMYAGKPVESGDADTVLRNPQHPYSVGLMDSVPVPGRKVKRLKQIAGEVPDVMRLPPGCSLRPRCSHAMPICHKEPPNVKLAEGHMVRCWLFGGEHEAG